MTLTLYLGIRFLAFGLLIFAILKTKKITLTYQGFYLSRGGNSVSTDSFINQQMMVVFLAI